MLPLEDRELLNQTMVGLNIDPETVSSLLASFDKAAEGVASNPVMPVQSASFGDSYTGGYRLGTNAEMAHQAVAQALLDMAAGLRQMASVFGEFTLDVAKTTEQTTATMQRIQAATDCVAAPTFSADQCSLPTEEG
ncbi:hypothetical protein ASG76_15165 [Nocardioides sp. Soil774]|uniref:hypothetical protein n=1 Tax=Nocardioides sp. Soil774 TaxID=1736408 RepID=UPI0006FE218D|nr:hypothetical protein [Nocardioides sp. Soil774]KRE92805.1 hypothetical protein ASG76_15165 [Nocardioides sp. Soil774]